MFSTATAKTLLDEARRDDSESERDAGNGAGATDLDASPHRDESDATAGGHDVVEQGDEADEAGASVGASQLIAGVGPTRMRDRDCEPQS